MKKMMKMALLAVAMTLTTSASAQVKFGIKGGINTSTVSFSNDVFKADNRVGYFIGPTLKITLPVVGLGIDASALYEQREARLKATTGTENGTMKQQQIAIPVNARYGFGLGETANIFFFAGPQINFNVGNKDKTIVSQVADWRLKTSNFSVNAGIGATLLSHLQVTLNYNIACGKTGEVTLERVQQSYKGRSNAWQLGVAYFF